jgi:hypothetical protein
MPENLECIFETPPKEYRIAPFWFLNHECDPDEIRAQIAEMDDKGVGGAVLHPRHGMKVKYMSSEYMDMIQVCIDEMHKRGMKVWLYDENNWPSGTYDGELPRNNPQYRMRYIRIESFKAAGRNSFIKGLLYEEGNSIIDIQAARYEEKNGDILVQKDSIISIADKVENQTLTWEAPEGDWLVCIFWECFVAAKVTYKNGYYLDTMNEDAVKEFIRLAYEPYTRFSQYFGNTVQGVFTDEPGLMIHDGFIQPSPIRTRIDDLGHNLAGFVLAWTRGFFIKFENIKGYDLKSYLFALLYDIGEDTRRIRLDYYDAITQLYVDSYHKAIGTWCRLRDLKYIGHTLEEPLWGQIRTQGNQTKVLQQMDYPGYDYLGQGVGTKENPYRILSAKCASSVAHIEGKRRVACESFGGGGHNHSLFSRKLDANFMAILGTNMFIPHGFYYSFEGYRKTDWPPTEFYHAPHWPYYKGYADYLARLSLLGALGNHRAAACVVSPVKTVSMDMFKNGLPEMKPESDVIFSTVSDLLLRFHYDFDYIDDCQLSDAVISDREIGFPDSSETFPLVIMPMVKIISQKSALKMKGFFNSGGRILFIGCIPEQGEQKEDDGDIADIFRSILKEEHIDKRVHFISNNEELERNLFTALNDLLTADICISMEDGSNAEDILCCRRDIDGRSFYMLFNRLMQPQKIELRFNRVGFLNEWNLEDGSVAGTGACSTRTAVDFAEAQMRVFEICECSIVPDAPAQKVSITELTIPDNEWTFSIKEPNVLKLDEWTYRTRDWHAMDTEGISGTPGQVNSYTTTFEVENIPEGEIRLILDDLKQWIPSHVGFLTRKRSLEIYINDTKAEALRPSRWQEKQYREVDITGMLVKGKNKVTIHTISLLNPMHSLVEPVYLLGNFMLRDGRISMNTGKIIGYWSENGFPYYSGTGVYACKFELKEDPGTVGELILHLNGVRDGCSVRINNINVCVRYWPPFSMDILKYVKLGINSIEIEVFNTLENLYGRNVLQSGFTGARIMKISIIF